MSYWIGFKPFSGIDKRCSKKEYGCMEAVIGEVWRFGVLKSDFQGLDICNYDLSWYAIESTLDIEPCQKVNNVFTGSAGCIRSMPDDRYSSFEIRFYSNVVNKSFAIDIVGESGYSYDGSLSSIQEVARDIQDTMDGVIVATAKSGRVLVKLRPDYAGGDIEINKSGTGEQAVIELDCVKVKGSESENIAIEVVMPCRCGWYQLAIVKKGEVLPYLVSNVIEVVSESRNTSLLQYSESKAVFDLDMGNFISQIRLPIKARFDRYFIEEEYIDQQKLKRKDVVQREIWEFNVAYAEKYVHDGLILALKHTDVWIDGIKFYQNNQYEITKIRHGEVFGAKGELWRLDVLKENKAICKNVCNSNEMATIKRADDTVFDVDMWFSDANSELTQIEYSESVNVVDGRAELIIENKSLTGIDVQICLNGLECKLLKIEKCKKVCLTLNICKKDECSIKVKRSSDCIGC